MRATTDDDAMSSTLEQYVPHASDATVLRANSRNPWSNVLNFGWETLLYNKLWIS